MFSSFSIFNCSFSKSFITGSILSFLKLLLNFSLLPPIIDDTSDLSLPTTSGGRIIFGRPNVIYPVSNFLPFSSVRLILNKKPSNFSSYYLNYGILKH